MSEFNTRFREVRKKLKLTLREMSGVLGIPLSTVSKYEQGVIKPGVEILSRVCVKYNVNLNWLLTGAGEMFIDKSAVSASNYLKVKAKRNNGGIEVTSTSDRFLLNPTDYKNVNDKEYEKLMHKIASKTDRFVVTEFTNGSGGESFLIYYPNKHSEALDKTEVLKRDKLVSAIKNKLDTIYADRSMLECVNTVINSLEDKKSFEEIKDMLKHLGVTLS